MKAHDLANILLAMPNLEVVASTDIETKVYTEHGDEIIAKVFSYGIVEVFSCEHTDVTILFESSESGGEGVDVMEVVHEAQVKLKEK